jgi:hypothetical protein
MAVRRERERRAVLAEAVAEMRRRGNPEFEAKDLFMDFNGIQVTLAVMARALINGRIDCKTAGRLVVQLQTFSKLLWIMQRAKTKTLPLINTDDTDLRGAKEPRLPQISADERRAKASTTKDIKKHEGVQEARSARSWAANRRKETLIAFVPNVLAFADIRSWAHGPPEWVRAA